MRVFVALLRAVNVGGTGKLPMSDLKVMCDELGFIRARTYIASGNVVFESDLTEPELKAALEARLHAYAGKPVGVLVRNHAEMTAVEAGNPFSDKPANRVVTIFLDSPPPADFDAKVTGRKDEATAAGAREIYVHYGDGMASTRLKIPAAMTGTARNMNTVRILAAMMGSGALQNG
jgi:uncharacterized protein (DUF1697 family)